MNLNFEAVAFYLFTLVNRQNRKHNENLVDRQKLIVLARPTNNAEQFCDKEKEASFSAHTSHNFSLVCMTILASTGSTSHFFHLLQCRRVNFIFTKCLNM